MTTIGIEMEVQELAEVLVLQERTDDITPLPEFIKEAAMSYVRQLNSNYKIQVSVSKIKE